MIDYKAVAMRIREERRLNKRVSQEEMAAALGIYQADVSNLERARKGSGISDLNRLGRIADYFGIPLEQLLFGNREKEGLVRYERKPRKLRFLSGAKDFSETETKILTRIFGADPAQLPLRSMQYGPYRTFYFDESLALHLEGKPPLPISKMHVYVFCKDKVIASMKVSCLTLFLAMNQPLAHDVQILLPWRVFDFSEVVRRVNPYVPLLQFEKDPEKCKAYEEQCWARLNELRPIRESPIAIMESAYVREDFRRLGIFRMMLDGLARQLGAKCSYWLNLEPADDEDLEKTKTTFPEVTTSSLGQISMNAHIAECLGFRLENDLWTIKVNVETSDGKTRVEERKVRKVAYKLSRELSAILAKDGDLVDTGRLLQRLAALQDGKQHDWSEYERERATLTDK